MKQLFLSMLFLASALFGAEKSSLKWGICSSSDNQFLVDFAIKSNDIYKTRTADREVARVVFDISLASFDDEAVEVLKSDNDIIGFYTLKIDPDKTTECELGHLFVKAGLQKKGFGSILFDRACEAARKRGFTKMRWISDPDSKDFYLKKKATIVTYDVNLLNPSVDVPIFELELK